MDAQTSMGSAQCRYIFYLTRMHIRYQCQLRGDLQGSPCAVSIVEFSQSGGTMWWQVHAHEGDNVETLTNEAAVLAVRWITELMCLQPVAAIVWLCVRGILDDSHFGAGACG
jgi:hypothetical protein